MEDIIKELYKDELQKDADDRIKELVEEYENTLEESNKKVGFVNSKKYYEKA